MLGRRARPVAGRGPRRTRRGLPRGSRDGRRRAGVARTGSGSRPTCGSPRASWSRTSSPGSAAGPKMVAPGLAGLDTVLALHNARRIGDPRATWGVTDGNPVHDAIRAIAAAVRVDFALDVLIDDASGSPARSGARSSRCTPPLRGGAGRGDAARRAPVRHRRDHQQRLPPRPEPVPGGQGHVGGRHGRRDGRHDRVRRGVPRRPPRPRLVRRAARIGRLARGAPGAILAPPVTQPDQWQVQVQARVQAKARVLLRADGLSDAQVRAAHLDPRRT